MRTVISCICLLLLLGCLEVQGVHKLGRMLSHNVHKQQRSAVETSVGEQQELSEVQQQLLREQLAHQAEAEPVLLELQERVGATVDGTAAAVVVATTTAPTMTQTTSGAQDTSAILDSYRDLEERVGKLEQGGVQRRVQAGDAIAAAKAEAEAMIRAALQDVANGAQAQAAAAAAAAAEKAAQDAANAANNANSGGGNNDPNDPNNPNNSGGNNNGQGGQGSSGTNGGGGDNPAPPVDGGGGDGTGSGCCSNAIDQVARAANGAASDKLAAMAAQIASLQAVLQGMTTTKPPIVGQSSAGLPPTDDDSQNQGQNNPSTAQPPPLGQSSAGLPPPLPSTASNGGDDDSQSSSGGSSIIDKGTGTVVDPAVVDEQRRAHAAATEALLRKLDLNDKQNLDPSVMKASAKLVSDLGDKHEDFLNQLTEDCAEPTCPRPAGVVAT